MDANTAYAKKYGEQNTVNRYFPGNPLNAVKGGASYSGPPSYAFDPSILAAILGGAGDGSVPTFIPQDAGGQLPMSFQNAGDGSIPTLQPGDKGPPISAPQMHMPNIGASLGGVGDAVAASRNGGFMGDSGYGFQKPADMTDEQAYAKMMENSGMPRWWPSGFADAGGKLMHTLVDGHAVPDYKPGGKAAGPKPVDPLDFSTGFTTSHGGSATPQSGPGHTQIDSVIQGMFPGAKITSDVRSPAHNKDVGGVPNSLHLTGMATDFVLPQGADHKAAMAALKAAGFNEVLDEGNHIHAGIEGGPIGQMNPTVAPGSTQMPVSFVDPATAMGMIGPAAHVHAPTLPNAPHRELPGDVPLLDMLDKAGEMAPFAAQAPKARDAKGDTWDKISAMLASAAAGATHYDPQHGDNIGKLLLLAGTGGAAGFAAKKGEIKADTEKHDEEARQFQLQLAKMGFDIDKTNLDTGNLNKDRTYKSGENKKDVTYGNAQADFERGLKQAGYTFSADEQNVGADNTRNLARSNVGITALQGVAGAQNTANSVAVQGGGAGAQEKGINGMLVGAGLDASNEKNPQLVTARSTAAAILANDVPGALNGFAQELVANGGAADLLKPQKGEDAAIAKVKQQAAQALKNAKKPSDPGAQQAMQVIAQLLNSNHDVALQVVKDYAGRGYPSAKLILNHAKQPAQ